MKKKEIIEIIEDLVKRELAHKNNAEIWIEEHMAEKNYIQGNYEKGFRDAKNHTVWKLEKILDKIKSKSITK